MQGWIRRQANGDLRERGVGQDGVPGTVGTYPEMIDDVLQRFKGLLDNVGLERGPFMPHLFRSLEAIGYPMMRMATRRATDH